MPSNDLRQHEMPDSNDVATVGDSTAPTEAPAAPAGAIIAASGRAADGTFIAGNAGGKPGRSGPPGNQNAAKHLIYAGGSLPSGASYVRKLRDRLVQALRDAVLERHGEIDLVAAATIQSIGRHETVALLAQRWLRQRADKMSDSDWLTYAKAVADASDKRDRAIKALDLKCDPNDFWGKLRDGDIPDVPDDATPPPPTDSPACDTATPEATDGPTDHPASGSALDNATGPQDRSDEIEAHLTYGP